jgi:plastocyanin
MRPAAIGVVLVLLVGCESEQPTSTPAGAGERVTVVLTCDTGDPDVPCAFRPAEVTVPVGAAVRWVNEDATFHTVTASDSERVRRPNGLFDAVLDAEGEEFTRTFDQPGSYPYYCQPHAEFMAGVVRVVTQ